MLIAGIIIVVLGISDLVVAALMTRKETAANSGPTPSGGLGAEPSPVATIIRRAGAATVALGVVLIIVGLAS